MQLSRRNLRTLDAVARVLVPPGGSVPWSAGELDLARRIAADVEAYPPRVRRQIRLFLTGVEYLPLASGNKPFSAMEPEAQEAFLRQTYHHRSSWRRLLVSLLKQLCYTAYIQTPEVEGAIGYTYECLRPRDGVTAQPQEQIHH